MNLFNIKKQIQDYFHIEFDVKQNENEIIVYPSQFLHKNGFHVRVKIENDIRLFIIVEPQNYGRNILNHIKNSDSIKRDSCTTIAKRIKDGKFSYVINGNEYESLDNIDNESSLKSFAIKYLLFPFDNDEEKLILGIKIILSMFLSLLNYSIDGFEEGTKIEVKQNKYERNPLNRTICLYAKGYTCAVCGFNFEDVYGDIGKEFIHVHHTIPVSKMGDHYVVNPIEDLVPLCPNCHAMVHRKDPPYTVDEMKKIIKRIKE